MYLLAFAPFTNSSSKNCRISATLLYVCNKFISIKNYFLADYTAKALMTFYRIYVLLVRVSFYRGD